MVNLSETSTTSVEERNLNLP